MKKIAFVLCLCFFLVPSKVMACEPGDMCSPECLQVQTEVQEAVLSGSPYKNHGQLVQAVTHLTNKEKKAGRISGRCAACIKSQFAQRVPLNEQEPCGINSIARDILAFATDSFEKIRSVIDPDDKTKPSAEFIGNHVKVQSKKWVYVLNTAGQQIFRPAEIYPYLRASLSPERDITRILDRWIAQTVPESTVHEAKDLAMATLGVDYNEQVNAIPVRELIAVKSLERETTSHYEGRTMVLFGPGSYANPMPNSYRTSFIYEPEGGQQVKVEPVDLPQRSFETAITFAREREKARVIRVETSAPLPPEGLEIVNTFREGLLNGSIAVQLYHYGPLKFGAFFNPDEWRFEYTAYSFEGEDFVTQQSSCPSEVGVPYCVDHTSIVFDSFRNTPTYREGFLFNWCSHGSSNGIRGNCSNYDSATQSCLSWQAPNVTVIKHKNLEDYNFYCPPESPQCLFGIDDHQHCDGEWTSFPVGGGAKLEEEFYSDLEECHVAMISAHGGIAFHWEGFDFYQFLKKRDMWVSLHREADDGLGKGNLRHLILASCSSMNWIHGPMHHEPQNLFSDWMNWHVADGIRTVCGADSVSVGAHITGLRFFNYYHLGDSISQAWFNTELEKCEENTPVVVAYGGTAEQAASTLFDGRFQIQRAGTGHIIAAGLITPHLAQHLAQQ